MTIGAAEKPPTPAARKAEEHKNAIRRGRELEKRVAAELGGEVYRGVDGDVEAHGYRIECKYRKAFRLDSNTEFREFYDQVQRYRKTAWGMAKKWAIAFSGGSDVHGEILICLPIAEFRRLLALEDDARILARIQATASDRFEAFERILLALAADLVKEGYAQTQTTIEDGALNYS